MTSVKLIRNLEELQSYSKYWNDFLERSQNNNIFLTWEWLSNWARVYLKQNELLTLAVFEDEELVAIAPLWVEKVRFLGLLQLKVLKFLGSGEVCADHLDLIMAPKNAPDRAKEIWDYLYGPLRSEWDIFEYYNVPSNSPVLDAFYKLSDADDRCIKSEIVNITICPYIPLPNSWEEFLQSLSGTGRYSINYSKRRLSERGRLELRFCENSKDLPGEMQRLIILNQKSWNERSQAGSFATEEFKRFHQRVAKDCLEKGFLFLCSLWLDEEHLGSFYGFGYNNNVYFYIISVERSPLKRVNVGRTLLAFCIEETIKRGYREFDLLRGDEEYKYRWTNVDRRNLSLRFHNRKAKAFAFLLCRFTYDYIKQITKALLGEKTIFLKRLIKRKYS